MEYLNFLDFHFFLALDYKNFIVFVILSNNHYFFHDFRDSGVELYEFHNFRDAGME